MASKRKSGFFDEAGFPVGGSWDEITARGVKEQRLVHLWGFSIQVGQ